MSKISTILFDVGGVLLTNGWDHGERSAVLKLFKVDPEPFEERHVEANDEWEKGLITVHEYLERTVFYEPRPFTSEEFLAAMKARSILIPNSAIGILQQLAASQQWLVAILNNEARELNDYRLDRFELRRNLTCFFSSCYVGLRKPDPKIYQLALNVLQRKADEVVFIDDREENVKPAAQLGINTIQFHDVEQLKAGLSKLGVVLQ